MGSGEKDRSGRLRLVGDEEVDCAQVHLVSNSARLLLRERDALQRSMQAAGSSCWVKTRAWTWNLAARRGTRQRQLAHGAVDDEWRTQRTSRDLGGQVDALRDSVRAGLDRAREGRVGVVAAEGERQHGEQKVPRIVGGTHSSSQTSKRLVRSLMRPSLTVTSAYVPSCGRAQAAGQRFALGAVGKRRRGEDARRRGC